MMINYHEVIDHHLLTTVLCGLAIFQIGIYTLKKTTPSSQLAAVYGYKSRNCGSSKAQY